MLYLIRHPAVQPIPGQPAAKWLLSERGREQARQLAGLNWWPNLRQLYTSQEIKTIEAGAIIQAAHPHLKIAARPALSEVQRPASYVSDQKYRDNVARFLTQPDQSAAPGWETAINAQARLVAAVKTIKQESNGQNCALISHGLVLTLYRAYCLGQPATLADWQRLSMGCWAVLDNTGRWAQNWMPLTSVHPLS